MHNIGVVPVCQANFGENNENKKENFIFQMAPNKRMRLGQEN